ncbi:AAA family ATPase [Cupriavidus necator]|uniref:AAA ATPase, central region n=1 Tax=Cupriavidus pinatubonensis (strain JMP 134 / LMG 1197) TaxID=264198 RepID=Q46MB5_CUPPJ|nr:AAA family ATPase [Cupriavidus necator]
MDREIVDMILGLAQQGVRGDRRGFQLRLRRIVSRLREAEPQLAGDLMNVLSRVDAPTRETYPNGANERPAPEKGPTWELNRAPDLFSADIESQSKQGDLPLFETPLPQAPVDSDSRQTLVSITRPGEHELRQPVWSTAVSGAVTQLLREWTSSEALRTNGLSPMRSLLLAGPPGVGKTLTASWIAAKLSLPLLTLDLSTVMSSFLGKTGNNIRSVLDYAKTFPCVLLLDEFDAIAKRRDDETDVGELKRLVTVLLQSVDSWPDTSLLIAATNHEDLLDPAVWRRFDLVLQFDLPSPEAIEAFLAARGVSERLAKILGNQLKGQPYARIEKTIDRARKASILNDEKFEDSLCQVIIAQMQGSDEHSEKEALALVSMHMKGLSQREIAKKLGIAHSTVGRQIKQILG